MTRIRLQAERILGHFSKSVYTNPDRLFTVQSPFLSMRNPDSLASARGDKAVVTHGRHFYL